MAFHNVEEWPDIGELVVVSVVTVTNYGAYVKLDEYDKEGFLHISEISSSWVKNIRDFIHEGEKVVLKVLRVDPEKRHIDLSLRRVTKRERREKLLLWKQSKKAESLLRNVSKKMDMPLEDLYEKVWIPLEKAFDGAYNGLEIAAREGIEALLEQGIPQEIAETLTKIAKERIKISMVKVNGILKIRCPQPDGVLKIKEALLKARKIKASRGTEILIHLVAPPKYRIEVKAPNYKEANTIIKKAADAAILMIEKNEGEGTFERG
jgi:translation initiation factor 2 subunit 1